MTRRMMVVTGGAGFIGSNIVARLAAEDRWDVVVCDRFETADLAKWRNLSKHRVADWWAPDELFQKLEQHAEVVDAVIHEMLVNPISGANAKASSWFGAAASAAMVTPKARAEVHTSRTSTLLRLAARSAPRSEPTLVADIRSVKVTSLPSRSRVAKSGRTVEKLKARVPITAIITSGSHSSGTLRA